MIKKILNALKDSEATAYKIIQTKTTAHEFFFIKHRLDMNRKKDVVHTLVTVYKASDDNQYLGSSQSEFSPSFSEEEIKQKIEQMVFAASLVKNPYYQIPDKQPQEGVVTNSSDIKQIAMDIINTVNEVKETENTYINSYEIFVNRDTVRIINSNELDVGYTVNNTMLEIVLNAKNGDHEIELYRNYVSDGCDKNQLLEDISQTMKYGLDRTKATKTPKLDKQNVLFTNRDVARLCKYYADMTNAGSVYQQISTYKIGESITTKNVNGDKITLTAVKNLANSSKNAPFDDDGISIKDKELISENVVKEYWGSKQFCDYINYDKPGKANNFIINGGKYTKEELMEMPHFEVVEFSDFQVNPTDGEFAGEIRLAYYYDGEKTTVVTGGSINGNMIELQSEMYLSSQTKQYNNIVGPAAIMIKGVTVSSVE